MKPIAGCAFSILLASVALCLAGCRGAPISVARFEAYRDQGRRLSATTGESPFGPLPAPTEGRSSVEEVMVLSVEYRDGYLADLYYPPGTKLTRSKNGDIRVVPAAGPRPIVVGPTAFRAARIGEWTGRTFRTLDSTRSCGGMLAVSGIVVGRAWCGGPRGPVARQHRARVHPHQRAIQARRSRRGTFHRALPKRPLLEPRARRRT